MHHLWCTILYEQNYISLNRSMIILAYNSFLSDTRIWRNQPDLWIFKALDRSQANKFHTFQGQGYMIHRLWTKLNLIKQKNSIRSQNKSASLKTSFLDSSFGFDGIDDLMYYGSGFNFRPDVLCDIEGKLRNWRKVSRLKTELLAGGSIFGSYSGLQYWKMLNWYILT